MKIVTDGRTDIKDLFKISGILEASKLNHTPFLAFIASGDKVTVEIVNSAKKLLTYPNPTPVMVQWRGQWSSDFFRFTVKDVRQYLSTH